MAKKIHTLVIDTNAILQQDASFLRRRADHLYTVPSVISELKDRQTRQRIETTLAPFLTQRKPSSNHVNIIRDFARRTGDLGVLSATDVELLALTRQLECEQLGSDSRLRKLPPGQKRPSCLASAPTEPPAANRVPPHAEESPPPVDGEKEEGEGVAGRTDDDKSSSGGVEELSGALAAAKVTEEEEQQPGGALDEDAAVTSDCADSDSENDSNDDGGWITPSNVIRKNQELHITTYDDQATEQSVAQVALATADFAMQNVALQMGLNLFSATTIQRIAQLRTMILRCHGCFATCRDTTRQFCPRCGQATLTRVTSSTDADGTVCLHLSQTWQWNTRGARYSIPKPASGTASGKLKPGQAGQDNWGTRLILAEDQKEYARARQAGNRPRVGAGRHVNARRHR